MSIDGEFVSYYQARAEYLRTTAYLLCGDWHLAQDLTQLTFTKMYRRWRRIERHEVLDQYARRVLLRAYLDERRRPWRREVPTETIDATRPARPDGQPDDRVVLRSALMRLPPRQRAALVLRYWLDLSIEQTAAVLGCTSGTVKSQTADGLANLRRLLGGLDGIANDFGHISGGTS